MIKYLIKIKNLIFFKKYISNFEFNNGNFDPMSLFNIRDALCRFSTSALSTIHTLRLKFAFGNDTRTALRFNTLNLFFDFR